VVGLRLEDSLVVFGADRSSAYMVDCHHLLTHWTTYELLTESKKCHMRSALCCDFYMSYFGTSWFRSYCCHVNISTSVDVSGACNMIASQRDDAVCNWWRIEKLGQARWQTL